METTNFGNFNTLKLIGYKYSNKLIYLTVWLISFGLIKHIPIKIQILLFYKKCLLSKSTHVLVEGFDNFKEIVKVETEEIPILKENDNIINQFGNVVRYFEVFKTKFLFNRIQEKFMRPIYPEHEMKQKIEFYTTFFKNQFSYIDFKEDSYFMQKLNYGENTTDLPLPTILEIFIMNLFTLENLYLLSVLIIWYFTDYKIYAIILLSITFYTLSVDIYKKICSNKKILSQTKNSDNTLINKLYIINNKIIKKEIDTKYLFPGDLIELRNCKKFCCDAIIIKGSLLVDESFLTGESIPIPKYENDTIFCGTQLSNTSLNSSSPFNNLKLTDSVATVNTESNTSCIAMVTKTGFNTSHGSLLKTILFPKKSNTDTFRHINIIFKIGLTILCGLFIFMVIYFILIQKQIIKLYITRVFKNNERKYQVILNLGNYGPYLLSFDLVTVLMSPAFSAALKLGLMNSISRLKNSSIDCMLVSAIDEVGLVDVAVFDKTGTLTESYMELYKTVLSESNTNDFAEKNKLMEITKATCHNLQFEVHEQDETNQYSNKETELLGDPMDISMVKSTKATFLNSNSIILDYENQKIEIEIQKRIPFSTERKRISVFLKIGKKNLLITKGSPEIIENLVKTVPEKYKIYLENFALQGYRVLSVGYKEFQAEISGVEETDIEFLGFIIFSNPLKKDTKKTIASLKHAEIPSIICTGDSILTGLSVARELKIVEGDVVMPVVNTEYKETEGEEVIKPDNIQIQKEDEENASIKKSRFLLGKKILKPIQTNELVTLENSFTKNTIKITANDTTSPLRWICTNIKETDLGNIPIAIEGPCFNYIRENEADLYKQILKRCKIYARMNPEQKMHLVNDLKCLEKEYFFSKLINNLQSVRNNTLITFEERIFNDPYDKYVDIEKDKLKVLYCGDGANDCGALNASTIGISLSPHISICQFISRTGNINNVKTIISEGRSALVTSMSAFRNVCETSILSYIVLGILMIGGSFLSEYETMYHDLCLILPLNILLSTFKPLNKLWNINKFKNNTVTLNRFLYVEILNSLKFIMLSVFSAVCILTYFFLVPDCCSCFDEIQSEFIISETPLMFHTKKSTIFYFVLSIQIFLSCIYNCRGEPHRAKKYKNFAFLFYVLANSTIFLFLCTLAIGLFPKIAKKMFMCKLNYYEILLVVVLFLFNILTYMYLHKREGKRLTSKENKRKNK